MNTDKMGVYGNFYLKRAIVAQLGLGAHLPEDAIYPLNLADDSGKPLDGGNKYTIHFDKGATPPAALKLLCFKYSPTTGLSAAHHHATASGRRGRI